MRLRIHPEARYCNNGAYRGSIKLLLMVDSGVSLGSPPIYSSAGICDTSATHLQLTKSGSSFALSQQLRIERKDMAKGG